MLKTDARQLLEDCCLRVRADRAHMGVAGLHLLGGVENTLRGYFPPLVNPPHHQKKNSRLSDPLADPVAGLGCGFGFAFTASI